MNARHTVRTIATAERGAALVMTLLVLIILTAFGLTLVAVGMTEMAISSNWRDYSKDFYAAEAALESGVVALRNLLATTPTPTQPQLNTIATAPTLSDTRMTFGAHTITPASPAPSRQTFATGPYNGLDRKSTRLNSSHGYISYAVFCLKKKKKQPTRRT